MWLCYWLICYKTPHPRGDFSIAPKLNFRHADSGRAGKTDFTQQFVFFLNDILSIFVKFLWMMLSVGRAAPSIGQQLLFVRLACIVCFNQTKLHKSDMTNTQKKIFSISVTPNWISYQHYEIVQLKLSGCWHLLPLMLPSFCHREHAGRQGSVSVHQEKLRERCIHQVCTKFRIELRMTPKFPFNSWIWIWIDIANRKRNCNSNSNCRK